MNELPSDTDGMTFHEGRATLRLYENGDYEIRVENDEVDDGNVTPEPEKYSGGAHVAADRLKELRE